jgi:hypothetical protein
VAHRFRAAVDPSEPEYASARAIMPVALRRPTLGPQKGKKKEAAIEPGGAVFAQRLTIADEQRARVRDIFAAAFRL